MGTVLPVVGDSDALQWTRAQDSFNAWRGRCVHAFTFAEAEISEALLAWHERDATTKLPHLAGQRAAALLATIERRDEPTDAKLMAALKAIREHEPLRTALCHGRARLLLDREGRWTAVVRTLVFRANVPERLVTIVEEREAAGIASDVTRDANLLAQRLRDWRKAL